jgi:hypothetical protein
MKKIVVSMLLLAFAASSALAVGEVNLKAGLDIAPGGALSGDWKGTWTPDEGTSKADIDNVSGDTGGITFTGEFLYPVTEKVKVGGGLSYLMARKANLRLDHGILKNDSDKVVDMTLSYIPIYATVQFYPLSAMPEVYFKGDLGYSMFYLNWVNLGANVKDTLGDETLKGGIYIQLASGYELKNGLILELSWTYITSSAEYKRGEDGGTYTQEANFVYRKIGLTAGYKFKL